MTSLTTRGVVALVTGFVTAAGLCAGAAVALVNASDHSTTNLLPELHPTLVFPTGTPTASAVPAASASPTGVASPTPTRSAGGTPRVSSRATGEPGGPSGSTPVPVPVGPGVDAVLDPASGDTTTATVFHLAVHATSEGGTLTLTSVDWGDGTVVPGADGTRCQASAGGDCENYALTHTYSATGTYSITVVVSDGTQSTNVGLQTTVKSPSPSPTA